MGLKCSQLDRLHSRLLHSRSLADGLSRSIAERWTAMSTLQVEYFNKRRVLEIRQRLTLEAAAKERDQLAAGGAGNGGGVGAKVGSGR